VGRPFAQGKAYQLTHSLIAFGRCECLSWAWAAVSRSFTNYLPEAHTDFMLAVIGETRFCSVVLVVILMATGSCAVRSRLAVGAPH